MNPKSSRKPNGKITFHEAFDKVFATIVKAGEAIGLIEATEEVVLKKPKERPLISNYLFGAAATARVAAVVALYSLEESKGISLAKLIEKLGAEKDKTSGNEFVSTADRTALMAQLAKLQPLRRHIEALRNHDTAHTSEYYTTTDLRKLRKLTKDDLRPYYDGVAALFEKLKKACGNKGPRLIDFTFVMRADLESLLSHGTPFGVIFPIPTIYPY